MISTTNGPSDAPATVPMPPATHHQQPACSPGAEVAELPGGPGRTAGQQRRLHRLEQEQRIAGDDHAVDEVPCRSSWDSPASSFTSTGPMFMMAKADSEATSSRTQRCPPREAASGPLVEIGPLHAQRHGHGQQAGDADRHAERPGVVTPPPEHDAPTRG
jgi:hypothetical protein